VQDDENSPEQRVRGVLDRAARYEAEGLVDPGGLAIADMLVGVLGETRLEVIRSMRDSAKAELTRWDELLEKELTSLGAVEDRPKDRRRKVVYFLRFGDVVKIGYTGNFSERMKNYGPHELLCVIKGDMDRERQIHALFRDDSAQGREWFRYTQRLQDFVDGMIERGWDIREKVLPFTPGLTLV
jgi:T5orf172 domain